MEKKMSFLVPPGGVIGHRTHTHTKPKFANDIESQNLGITHSLLQYWMKIFYKMESPSATSIQLPYSSLVSLFFHSSSSMFHPQTTPMHCTIQSTSIPICIQDSKTYNICHPAHFLQICNSIQQIYKVLVPINICLCPLTLHYIAHQPQAPSSFFRHRS